VVAGERLLLEDHALAAFVAVPIRLAFGLDGDQGGSYRSDKKTCKNPVSGSLRIALYLPRAARYSTGDELATQRGRDSKTIK
jgi:hypothetical protein